MIPSEIMGHVGPVPSPGEFFNRLLRTNKWPLSQSRPQTDIPILIGRHKWKAGLAATVIRMTAANRAAPSEFAPPRVPPSSTSFSPDDNALHKTQWFEQEKTEKTEFSSLFPPFPPVPKFFICVRLRDLRANAFVFFSGWFFTTDDTDYTDFHG